MKRLTIKEIARKAEVSPTAVSFVLNGRSGVSEQTRKKIQNIIEQENYTPTRASRRLVLQRSYNIALMFHEEYSPFVDIFYWEITRSIMECCSAQNYNLVLIEVKQENEDARIPSVIKEKDVDGVICLHLLRDDIRAALKNENIPYVVVDTNESHQVDTLLYTDYQRSIDDAVNYLVKRGLKHIALLHSSYAENFYHTVYEGYKCSMRSRNLSIDERLLKMNCNSINSAYLAMKEILDSHAPLDAVLCTTIRFAIGAMKYVHHVGLSIPQDISFISLDDNYLAMCAEPELTTIPVDTIGMGRRAFEMVIKMIKGKTVNSIIMPAGELRIRGSVR